MCAQSISNRIQILPPIVAERIAAGEIIERPSSVVKELMENSLDAGATEIMVRLEDGGKALIEITDNGQGMSHDDLQLCIERHATSKLKSLDDLDRISTLGFRGEALPSIAAVSDLTFVSKTAMDDSAHELQVGDIAGRLLQKPQVRRITFGQFIDAPHGTRIQARGLFSQVPARLKFMKSQASEVSQVKDWLERLAVAHPQVGFQLISNERVILKLRPEEETDRVKSLLAEGEDFPILTASHEQDGLRDLGLKARIHWVQGLSSPNSRKLLQIVNSRAIRDRLLQQAILGPFKQMLLPGQFPALALFIDIHPASIDVNVHPTKTEIRFLDSRKIFQILDGLVKSLIKKQGAPSFGMGVTGTTGITGVAGLELDSFRSSTASFTSPKPPSLSLSEPSLASFSSFSSPSSPIPSIEQTGASPLRQGSILHGTRFVGILFRTYLMYERQPRPEGRGFPPLDEKDELVLIDQHAAHERIRYEALRKRFQNPAHRPLASQALLVPESIGFSTEHRSQLEDRLRQIQPWGFDGEIFGESAVLFRAVPAEWGHHQLKVRLKNLVDRLLSTELSSQWPSTENSSESLDWLPDQLIDEKLFETLASDACHSAVRAGDSLEIEEVSSLAQQLFETEHPWNCPHGRPTVVKVSRGKLEEWFQRKVSAGPALDL